jgi:hypothetical protein
MGFDAEFGILFGYGGDEVVVGEAEFLGDFVNTALGAVVGGRLGLRGFGLGNFGGRALGEAFVHVVEDDI